MITPRYVPVRERLRGSCFLHSNLSPALNAMHLCSWFVPLVRFPGKVLGQGAGTFLHPTYVALERSFIPAPDISPFASCLLFDVNLLILHNLPLCSPGMSNVEPLRVPTILESSLQRRGRHVPPIRRARAACTACRARKIRCTSREGEPCANCVFEHVQCMVMPRQRGSKKDVTSRTGRTALESDANTARPCGATIRQAPAADVEHHSSRRYQEPDYLPSAIPKTNIVDTKVSQSESSAIVHQLRSAGPDGAISDAGDGETGWLEAAIKAVPLPRILDASSPPVLQSWPQLGSGASQCSAGFQASPVVPSFLKQPPPGLTEDDLNHLHRRGALSIPEPGLRDALIDSYLLYFHPSHPMLDVDSLYSSVRGDSRQQFSLLVFQAIMFVGSCWVDHKLLRRLGFLSRRAARKAFYWRARVSSIVSVSAWH